MSTETVQPIFTDDAELGRSLSKKNYRSCEIDSDSSWNDETESYIREILADCQKAARAHEEAGYSAKSAHARWAFPGMLIPTVAAPVVGTFKEQWWCPYVSMCSMVMVAVCNGFSNFYNFGEKSQQHFNFAGRYSDVVTDIKESLAKSKHKRASGQVVMRTVKMKYDALNLSAPET